MSDSYSNVVGGGLKLKGAGLKDVGIKKKKKKKDKDKDKDRIKAAVKSTDFSAPEGDDSKQGREAYVEALSKLTEAERRKLQKQKEREEENIAKRASKSHRERIEEFNNHLASLSEHYDIPKVAGGG